MRKSNGLKRGKHNYYSWILIKNRKKRKRVRRKSRVLKISSNNNQTKFRMIEFKIKHLRILKGNYKYEKRYRPILSKLIIEKFGRGPYNDQQIVREVLAFSYNFFCDEFVNICQNEKSVRFYQYILSQHEQTIEIAFFAQEKDMPEGITLSYISVYRRVLKWILEQACDITLNEGERISKKFKNRSEELLNELYFLGDMIMFCTSMYAEQDMIEDVADVSFDRHDEYIFHHKHHYDIVLEKIKESFGVHLFKHVVDASAVEDFSQAIHTCFGIRYDYLTTVISEIHKANKDKGGQYCGFGWESLPMSVNSMFGSDPDQARVFYKGLTLSRDNKLKLHDLACKPYSLNRYLYRPILIWNIEGVDYAIITDHSFRESIIQLTTNAIPWGKAPVEWYKYKCFKEYVHSKEDSHDKWFDNDVEERLRSEPLQYHRNVTYLKNNKSSVTLNVEGVGEIDFIIIEHTYKKIYVADCKHLQSKYDMMSQKNDYSNFYKGDKCYNKQIERKVNFIKGNISVLDFHNKEKYGQESISITDYSVEGIFIINTPTFYMFNSEYRIYTIDVFIDLILKRLTDPEFIINIEDGEKTYINKINYPYFRKPEYKLIDLLKTED